MLLLCQLKGVYYYYVTCRNQLTWTSRRHDLLIENKRLWLSITDSFQSPLMRSKVQSTRTQANHADAVMPANEDFTAQRLEQTISCQDAGCTY